MTYTYIRGPTDKHDHASVAYLDTLPTEQWKHLIWDLMIWLADVNWPIFVDVRDLLLKNPRACLGGVRKVLEIEDEGESDWQNWVLTLFVANMPDDCIRALVPDLINFRRRISDEVDDDWGMRESVDELLANIDGKWELERETRDGDVDVKQDQWLI